jgi:hypothetical protein
MLTRVAIAASILLATTVQNPRVGIVDFYGLGHVSESQARTALGIREGDEVPDSVKQPERRLTALPGVSAARVSRVCCEDGKAIIYVGLEERDAPHLQFRSAPAGAVRLPPDILKAGTAFDAALERAIQQGASEEDHSQGHALARDPQLRTIQEQFVTLANGDIDRLRAVVRESADAHHRALAAQVLAYARNKRAVVGDLAYAMTDPEGEVRNNATRALWIMAEVANPSQGAALDIPVEPFVDLLNSLVWEDRNKASLALMELSKNRDPALLDLLRKKALPSLNEMARWKSVGHATAPVMLFGRVAGISEQRLVLSVQTGTQLSVVNEAATQLGLK